MDDLGGKPHYFRKHPYGFSQLGSRVGWTFLPSFPIEISRLQREAEAEQLGHIARWELWNALEGFVVFPDTK